MTRQSRIEAANEKRDITMAFSLQQHSSQHEQRKQRRMMRPLSTTRRTTLFTTTTTALPLVLLFIFLQTLSVVTSNDTTTTTAEQHYLNQDSVVLITGAAGFLGSELALALHRTYSPKKIICVDSMDSHVGTVKSEEELALFEFKRQRAFHVLQTLGKKGIFYRADLAPSIPEYFNVGEVPILDYIMRDYNDITHIVHLAQNVHSQSQAVPRKKESVSAGMMEALLEQVVKMQNTTRTPPHVVYASSFEVYNYLHTTTTNAVPFTETKPITTPSSLRGASKLIDELLVRAYYETHGIYSVGLRFFSVYGPWGVPGSPLFEMAERAVTTTDNDGVVTMEESDVLDDVRDYVYIDDAVDALMAAMQYRTVDGAPVVINVGTGVGTSLHNVAQQIQDLFPSASTTTNNAANTNNKNKKASLSATIAYANTDRAKQLLGFEPRVSLSDGLVRLLSWHYDRAFPYGGRPLSSSTDEAITFKRNYIASQGIASCSPFDKECMRGAPVFPCASECSHESKCTSSVYDDVLVFIRSLTSKCSTVMYTVDMDEKLTAIPSANMAISTHHSSHLEDGCNIAFVSENSELVQRLKKEQSFSLSITAVETFMKFAAKSGGKSRVLKHGFWTLVPVSMPTFVTGDEHILDLLPKLSPGLFFGEATTHAIYCDPDVVFKDIPSLLQEAKMQPYRAGTQGATAMLVARERAPAKHAFGDDSPVTIAVPESMQNAAYRMVRIGVIDEMSGDGYHPLLDSSWVVHTLQKEDSRLFRCDVFGEVVQWDVGTDEKAFEFIMGLHDMWSRVIVQDNGMDQWWIGEGVITVPQNYGNAVSQSRRLEQVGDTLNDAEKEDGDKEETIDEEVQVVEKAGGVGGDKDAEAADQDDNEEVGDSDEAEEEGDTADEEADSVQDDTEEEAEEAVQEGAVNAEDVLKDNEDAVDDDEGMDEEDTEDEEGLDDKGEAFANEKGNQAERVDKAEGQEQEAAGGAAVDGQGQEANGFLNAGNDLVDVDVGAEPQDDNADQNVDNEDMEDKDDDEMDSQEDEETQDGQAQVVAKPAEAVPDQDHSSYDTWMGILSSTKVHYFVRIVPSSEVGATYLEDYNY